MVAELQYPFPQPPATGTMLAVAPGVHWLRMPLPFALDHINLWLLEDGDGWTAVDTGIALDPVKEAWKSVLAGRPEGSTPGVHRLRRQIVTHFHPDHLGLAAWLEAETGAPLCMTLGEYATAQLIANQVEPYTVATMIAFFRRHGLDEERCAALARRGNAYRRGVPAIPSTYRRLTAGETIAVGGHDWRVIVGHGHAPEHAALHCASLGVLISGDMLLPRISTNVSAFSSTPDCDALGQFLAAIQDFKGLPADTLVLPSHGLPFRGIATRVDQLAAHHEARCADLLAACSAPKNAAQLLPVLFPREITDAHQTMFAMGEAIAHLIHLEQQGRVKSAEENGVVRYVTTLAQ